MTIGGVIINISQQRLTMLVAAISQLIMQLIANMTVVALPQISEDLNFSAGVMLWVNLIYLMSFVAFSIPFAKIISQYGIKKCTKVSIIALFISVLLSLFSANGYMFLFSRLIQGLTSASLAISIYVMLVEEFSEHELGSALGAVSSAGYLGILIAPSFMGFIMFILNWQLAFIIMIPILAILLVLLNKIEGEWVSEKKPIDNIGSLLYVLAMISFTYGLTTIDGYGMIFVAISIILFAILIKVEKSQKDAIINFKLFKDMRYVIGNYGAMVSYFTTTIAVTALSLHLQYILNTEAYITGLVLIIAPIIMIGMSNISGKLSNNYDPRIISAIAMMFIFFSMTIYMFMDFLPFEVILLGCAFQGIGSGMFSAPNNKYVLTLVEEEQLAHASSILSTSKEFGKILSTGIFTLILSAFIGNQTLGSEQASHLLIISSNLMMFICALIALSAAILLFYSKYRYELDINPRIVKIFKSIAPKWSKKE